MKIYNAYISAIGHAAFSFFTGDVITENELRLPSGLTSVGSRNSGLIPDRSEVDYFKIPDRVEEIGGSNYIDLYNVYVLAGVETVGNATFGTNGGSPSYQT